MVGDFKDVSGMDAVPGAKAGDAFRHCGAGDSIVEEKVEDAGIDGNAVMFGPIT